MKLFKIISLLAIGLIATQSAAADDNLYAARDTITDPYLVYPESYEADVHKMQQDWYMQNYIVLDRNAETSADENVSDEEIIRRLQAMPTVIEMPFNSIVRAYIDMYTQRKRVLVENMLGMSLYYMPIFEVALEQEGVPLELKYLPIVESALNPNAVSRAGATGLWQFMLPTGRDMGLEINSLVDQRRDPIASSRAAARYLRQLHDIYNDWSLAIAAYNCGPGNVNRALRQAGEGKKDFWEIYPYLPRETRGYLPTFIAANYVMHYYDRHNISPALARRPIITDTVQVNKRVHFRQIEDLLGVSIEALRSLNPQYREDVVPGHIHSYTLILPSYQSLAYNMSEDSISRHLEYLYNPRAVVEPSTGASYSSDDGQYIITEKILYHKVRKGDTFAKLAKRYGVTASSIKKANGIKTLTRGRTIKIVTTVRTPKPAEEKEPEAEEIVPAYEDGSDVPDGPSGNLVIASDSIMNADPAGIEVEAIEAVEAVTAPEAQPAASEAAAQPEQPEKVETVKAEQPAKAADKPAKKTDKPKKQAEKPKNYKVRSGDNLSKIAKANGTTVEKLQKLNPGINPSKIRPGQSIRVK